MATASFASSFGYKALATLSFPQGGSRFNLIHRCCRGPHIAIGALLITSCGSSQAVSSQAVSSQDVSHRQLCLIVSCVSSSAVSLRQLAPVISVSRNLRRSSGPPERTVAAVRSGGPQSDTSLVTPFISYRQLTPKIFSSSLQVCPKSWSRARDSTEVPRSNRAPVTNGPLLVSIWRLACGLAEPCRASVLNLSPLVHVAVDVCFTAV